MKWSERYSRAETPAMSDISAFVANPLWDGLCAHIQTEYGVSPAVEYSVCSGAPGWNVKYRKSGRALCTLYPDEGFFTCLISVGAREADEAELLLTRFTDAVRDLYKNTKPFNGGRWLMIPVKSAAVLDDVKTLIALRAAKPKKASK